MHTARSAILAARDSLSASDTATTASIPSPSTGPYDPHGDLAPIGNQYSGNGFHGSDDLLESLFRLDQEKGLLVFHHLRVLGTDLGDTTLYAGFQRGKGLHDFDETDRIILRHPAADLYEGRSLRLRTPVKGPQ